uniref:Uncharacterized protein n=1 Tax=Coptotermes formosanus TaxID=36987 RepID=R4V0N3_COPFO|nr:hypothetical protein [Coptotermes formosanus]
MSDVTERGVDTFCFSGEASSTATLRLLLASKLCNHFLSYFIVTSFSASELSA